MSAYNTIQATVLQKNNNGFVCNPCGGYTKTMPIPVGDAAIPGENYWAVPVKDDFFQGFRYAVKGDTAAPTIDSIACFKLTNAITSDYFMVVGTVEQYAVYAAACCDTSPIPAYITAVGPIAPCQELCNSADCGETGVFDAIFAVQPIAEVPGGRYVATVLEDGAGIDQQTYATGSTSIANLVTYLNAQAGTVGTWSNPDENVIRLRTTETKTVCFIACIKTS